MSVARGAATSVLVAITAACSAGTTSPHGSEKASASAPSSEKTSLPYRTPGRWVVHPYGPSYGYSGVRLTSGGCALVERNGQRWTIEPIPKRPDDAASPTFDPLGEDYDRPDESVTFLQPPRCAGIPTAAVDRIPEAAQGIVRWPGAFGVVGESGVVHVSRSPLGPIVRRIVPPEPLSHVKSTGGAMIATSLTGRLHRWEEATGWQRVDIGSLFAVDLATARNGRVAVLAAPEAVLASEDAGRHFQRMDAPAVGAQAIAVSESGRILVEGALTSLGWDPREPAAFTPTAEPLVEPLLELSLEEMHYPSASALAQHRAALDGDTYWEISPYHRGEWMLFHGKLGEPLNVIQLPEEVTQNLGYQGFLGVRGEHVALATMRWDGRLITEVRVSHDGGRTFGPSTPFATGPRTRAEMAVSPEGAVLLIGACPDDGSLDEPIDYSIAEPHVCEGTPLLIAPDGQVKEPRFSIEEGTTFGPAFSPDGRSAYFLASSMESTHGALFVSHDGGETFEERTLEIETDDLRAALYPSEAGRIAFSEDGTLGGSMLADGDLSGEVYFTADADGRNMHAAELPEGAVTVGGAGLRAIAVPRYTDDHETVEVKESFDGGRTWRAVPSPARLRDTYFRTGDVRCSAAACLLGEDVDRIGWGPGAESVPFDPPKPPDPPDDLRTTIVCEPRPGSTWTVIENPQILHFPEISDVARGSAAWTLYTVDAETREVASVSASIPAKPGAESLVTRRRLLGPVPKKDRYALELRPQIEGVSLARLPVPLDPEGGDLRYSLQGRRVRDLEIAWENLEEGTIGHGRIADAGIYDWNTVIPRLDEPYMSLQMLMLSVAPKGIFVRTNNSSGTAFFVDAQGKIRKLEYPDWPSPVLGAGALTARDMVNVDGTFLLSAELSGRREEAPEVLLLMRPPARGSAPGTPWTPWAAMLAPPTDFGRHRFTTSNWTYEDGHYAIWSLHTAPDLGVSTAWIRRVLADGTLGPPRRVPTPRDLDVTPRGCTPEEHAKLPRLKVSFSRWGYEKERAGLRHPVLVRDPSEKGALGDSDPDPPISEDSSALTGPSTTETSRRVYPPSASVPFGRRWMLSHGVVLRGDGEKVCVDGLSAAPGDDSEHAVMIGGDLSYGWYFRLAKPLPVLHEGPLSNESDPPPPGYKPPPGIVRKEKMLVPPPPGPPRVEARPITCRFAPELAAPSSLAEPGPER